MSILYLNPCYVRGVMIGKTCPHKIKVVSVFDAMKKKIAKKFNITLY